MSKAWGSVGAWALEAEREEAEERERAAAEPPPGASPLLAGDPAQSFPSLKEANSSNQKKKKKPVTVPLSQFFAGGRADLSFDAKGLTPDEMLRLPTGPRERSQEELEYGRLGGGFRSYGGGGGAPRGGFPSRRADDGDGSWGAAGGGRRGYGGFDDEPRKGSPSRASDFDQPSRADEVDNWGAGKKSFAPPLADPGRRDMYNSMGSGSSSRADEVDSWSTAKKPLPSKYPSFGSGFRDSRALPDSDRWGRSREAPISSDQGRPKLILDPPKRDVAAPSEQPARSSSRPSPFGSARPREEVLAEKGLDWRQMDSKNEIRMPSRPTSSHSSRPSSAQSSRPVSPGLQSAAVIAVKPRPKVNPFGDAKPREILLQEKGIDWRKIDQELEHRRVERDETDDEKQLKEEINYLKSLIKETEGDLNDKFTKLPAEELHEEIARKEKDLELLANELDNKVRFGQRGTANIRPGSGAGRSDTSSTRPASQSGMSDGSRSIEFVDRPQSRGGTGNAWGDDRQGFQGGRDREFFDGRNGDRSSSKVRW